MINHQQAFDIVQQPTMANTDRDSIYLDAISLSSDKNSIGLSRQSIYHSIQDVHFGTEEETSINLQNAKNDKIWHRFHDGNHPVDFVLAYNGTDRNQIHLIKRQIYERNLTNEGLLLEKEETQKIHFVKLHIPKDVLCRYAEIMKMKFPIKQVGDQDEDLVNQDFELFKEMQSAFHKITKFIRIDSKKFPRKKYELFYEYSRDKNYLFNVQDPNFFSPATRIAIINFILERTRYSEDRDENSNCVGLVKLVSDQTYIAAYPLHDGNFKTFGTQRNLLYTEWSSIAKWMKYQPLDYIKEYFGAKVALYFAWLGFFSYMLVPAAVVGFICFLGGLFSIISSQYANEVCHSTEVMCPRCDNCDFWYLSDACGYVRISHLFDNNFTIFFAIFMSFWAIFYVDQWKRYSASIFHRWGLTGVIKSAERPRSAYMSKIKRTKRKRQKLNSVTRLIEPSVPFWRVKVPSYFLSYVAIALAAIVAIVIYRITVFTARQLYGNDDTLNKSLILIPITAAILNLVVLTLLNNCYEHLARSLTDMEYRRTQSDYDDSLSLKIYLFQFVNYYSAIIYIAFFKNYFFGSSNFFGLQQERYLPGGCLLEIFIQLAITMIGKQAISVALEISMPFLEKLSKILTSKFGFTKAQEENGDDDSVVVCSQWTEDFKLQSWNSMGLFDEYLEMIIQYGFLAFVVAFPLAPLFALINNIFEMRVDAKKFLLFFKRSVPKRVSDIGIWSNIVQFIGKLTVVISAFIIAFSSNFIPKIFYQFSSELQGSTYLEFMYTKVNVSDIQVPHVTNFENIEVCWTDQPKTSNSLYYWEILVARLLFVIIYQNVIGLIREFVFWVMPEKPSQLKSLIKREEYLTSQIIIMEERKRAMIQNMQAGLSTTDVTIVNRQRYYEAR